MDHLQLSPAALLGRMVKRAYVRPPAPVVPSTQSTDRTTHFVVLRLRGGRFGETADTHTGCHWGDSVHCREHARLRERAGRKQACIWNERGGTGQYVCRRGEGEHPGWDHWA